MTAFLSILLLTVFAGIAGLHFYWAFGGKKWENFAVPSYNEVPLFQPHFFETVTVAIGFILFALIISMKAEFLPRMWVSQSILTSILFGMAAVFLLRAVGEFKYIGFFKTIRDTPFGRMDTRYYSPLCLFIAILTLIINL
ncbi:MAG: DUF3995 domain-containing protein [Spirosomataceae bacterium]